MMDDSSESDKLLGFALFHISESEHFNHKAQTNDRTKQSLKYDGIAPDYGLVNNSLQGNHLDWVTIFKLSVTKCFNTNNYK